MVYSQVCRVPSFAVLSGNQVRRALHGRERRVLEIVEAAYRAHGAGAGGGVHVDGLRWAGSAGDAPAMLVLNDRETGYPFACMEGSIISAVRTAALAVLAAGRLSRGRGRLRRLGFAGLGSVAQYVYSYLIATGWRFDEIRGFDRADRAAGAFRSYVERRGGRVRSGSGMEELVRDSDLVVFANAGRRPHVYDSAWFAHNPLVLQLSGQDLPPEVVLASASIVDDVDPCGNADSLYDVFTATVDIPGDRPVLFTAHGLAVLDLAVGKHIYDEVRASGTLAVVDDFFAGPVLR